jgi:hypothetical protein
MDLKSKPRRAVAFLQLLAHREQGRLRSGAAVLRNADPAAVPGLMSGPATAAQGRGDCAARKADGGLPLVRMTAVWLTAWVSVVRLSAAVESVELNEAFVLPQTWLADCGRQPFTTADLARARRNGLNCDDLPSLGSGLARTGDGAFVGISDRGPNGEVAGRRTFPLPGFCPFIARFNLNQGRIEIQHTMLLTGAQGHPLSGLSNREGEERLFESAEAGAPLPFDPNGIDPEAIRVFPDGRFLISEEYGPSVLVVDTNGAVLVRYTPQTKPLPGATYPVRPILPGVLAQRRTNRCFEALALSPDGCTAWVMLQSPLGNATDPELGAARVVRALRLDVTDPLNARVTGEFLLPLSPAPAYAADLKQTAVKVNDAEWLAPDRLLLLEQAGATARLLVADFSPASNLQGNPRAATLALEAVGDTVAALGVTEAAVELCAVVTPRAAGPLKLEGLAVLSPTEIALANDNDFGQGEGVAVPSRVWKCRLPRPLPLAR